MRMRLQLLLLTTLLLLAACDYLPIGDPNAGLLMDRFMSGSSPEKALAGLPKRLTVVEDQSDPGNDKRPPYSMYTVAFEGISYCGQQGELQLSFFNGKLYKVVFHPTDPTACRVSFASSEVRVDEDLELKDANVSLLTAEDWRGRRYVSWSNRRSAAELDNWIATYG
jgi:hypothetical protein